MKRRVNRLERIGDMIHQSIATSLLKRVSDPRFQFVTVTKVAVSHDLSYARVYVSVLVEEEEVQPVIRALNHAAPVFRRYVSEDMLLRIVPELKFAYDDSIVRGTRIASLINQAKKDTPDDHE